MSDFSLMVEGVIVPPAVEAQGARAIVDHVKAAPNAPTNPAALAALDASVAKFEDAYPVRGAALRAAYQAAKAKAPAGAPPSAEARP